MPISHRSRQSTGPVSPFLVPLLILTPSYRTRVRLPRESGVVVAGVICSGGIISGFRDTQEPGGLSHNGLPMR